MKITGIHHVQLCIPSGSESEARTFYTEVLQLQEIQKPEALQKNGGFWLQIGNQELHIGIENQLFKGKHHPAFFVQDLGSFKTHLVNNGILITKELPIPGFNRFSIRDPFENRLEFIESV